VRGFNHLMHDGLKRSADQALAALLQSGVVQLGDLATSLNVATTLNDVFGSGAGQVARAFKEIASTIEHVFPKVGLRCGRALQRRAQSVD